MASFDYDVVIIGSGFGGSVAAPFRGVLPLPISALKSGSPVLRNLANRNRAVPLTYEQFCYAFANAVSEEEAHQLYEQFAVPTPGKPLFQAASANLHQPRPGPAADHLGRTGPHRPLGDRQRLLPAAGQPGATEIVEIKGRGHAPDHRQRLAQGRRHRPSLRPALHLVGA
jgi:non-heme chloroperoxidase